MHRCTVRRRIPSGPLISDIKQIFDAPDSREAVVPLPQAKVVIADYRSLMHDFSPIFHSSAFRERYRAFYCERCQEPDSAPCHRAIDQWLVDNAAVVSAQQAECNDVNSRIEGGTPVERGYRPPAYGRAMVLPVEGAVSDTHAAYLDIKGSGVGPGIVPSHARYSNGLEYLGVALADFFYAGLIDRIFSRTVPSYSVVPVYAVLDLGFDVTSGLYGTAPAGLHVRRAHARNEQAVAFSLWGSDVERISFQMELIFRAFGLTSSGPWSSIEMCHDESGQERLAIDKIMVEKGPASDHARHSELLDIVRNRRIDFINIQLIRDIDWNSRSAQIFDFGHFYAERRFETPFTSSALDRPYGVGRVVTPDDESFVQPEKGIAVDTDLCSRTAVNAMGFYLAQAFRSGIRSRDDIEVIYRTALLRAFGKKAS